MQFNSLFKILFLLHFECKLNLDINCKKTKNQRLLMNYFTLEFNDKKIEKLYQQRY